MLRKSLIVTLGFLGLFLAGTAGRHGAGVCGLFLRAVEQLVPVRVRAVERLVR